VLDGTVYFQLGLNPGIAFSLFTHASAVLLAIAGLGVAIGICVWALRARTFGAAGLVGLGMVASGAAGNAIDRVHMGRVTDFVVIQIASFRWPTFNVADAALVIGVIVLLVAGNRRAAPA
jgi:signal peptidase II